MVGHCQVIDSYFQHCTSAVQISWWIKSQVTYSLSVYSKHCPWRGENSSSCPKFMFSILSSSLKIKDKKNIGAMLITIPWSLESKHWKREHTTWLEQKQGNKMPLAAAALMYTVLSSDNGSQVQLVVQLTEYMYSATFIQELLDRTITKSSFMAHCLFLWSFFFFQS